MRIPQRARSLGFEFNMTPLIDVVFLLIIFFLVASYYVRNEAVTAVELPVATQSTDDEPSPSRLTITVDDTGTISLHGNTVDRATVAAVMDELLEKFPPETCEVRLRTDRRTPYERVEPLLLLAAERGIRQVRFSVQKPGLAGPKAAAP